jgi:hypothetical protein
MLQKIETCQPSDETSDTNVYQKHTPNNFAYYVKYCNNDYKPPVEYSGMDAAKVFYENLKKDALYIAKEYYNKIISMKPLTEQEKIKLKPQKECHICERSIDTSPAMLVRKILTHKNAIQYYKSLGDEKPVIKHSDSLKK